MPRRSELSELLAKSPCLVDFNPLVALWFACKDLPEKCGVAVFLPDNIKNFDVRTGTRVENRKIWRWNDMNNRRSIAQKSVFMFINIWGNTERIL